MSIASSVLFGARVSAGLLAGLYLAFLVAVMPALRGLDDAAFVDTMRRINDSIVNPLFLLVFFAAPVLTVVAAVVVRSPVLYAAAALGLVTLLITIAFNVPLNETLAAGGTRGEFESRWVLFNGLRVGTGVASLVCLLVSPSVLP